MHVSLNWLKEYVEVQGSVDALAHEFTMLGLEIEKIEQPGKEIEGVVIGQILDIAQHPDADKIVVCQTDTGGPAPLQICCGAKNMKVGDKVPTAVVGASLPGGFKIGGRKMRGVESQGMMCSSRELGLGEDQDGLMILPQDFPIGADARPLLGLDDAVYEIEVTPNRADWASMIGVARELAALKGTALRMPAPSVRESDTPASSLATLRVDDAALCPRYLGRVLLNAQVGESPLWLKRRLMAAGQRPINNIVDITNFVLLETGQPLHAFDLDRLAGHGIVVRCAGAGEKITTLDGQERALQPDMLVIADAERAQCVAGVMGGAHSEVTAGTTRIFLESAYFAPGSVRKTSRQLNLISESSQRFQRGADPEMARYAIERAAQLMQEIAGAEVCTGVLESYPEPFVPREITLRYARVTRLLGTVIDPADARGYLERLGFEILSHDDESVSVRVPLRRHDVSGEADLIEDIARLHGFERLAVSLPRIAQPDQILMPQEATVRRLRRYLAAAGLTEVYHWTFSNPDDVAKAELGPEYADMLALANPLSETHATMRSSLVPGLLNNIVHNVSHGSRDLAIFEIGPVYRPVAGQDLPTQHERLCIALSGLYDEAAWNRPARTADFYDLKGLVEETFGWFGVQATWRAAELGGFAAGQAAEILLGNVVVGRAGRVKASVLKSFGLGQDAFLAEIDLDALLALPVVHPRFQELAPFPASLRDLAVIVSAEVPVGDLIAVAREAGGKLLVDVSVFDIYTGNPVPAGRKSVALGLVYQSPERTLTDKDTQKAQDKILKALETQCGAQLR